MASFFMVIFKDIHDCYDKRNKVEEKQRTYVYIINQIKWLVRVTAKQFQNKHAELHHVEIENISEHLVDFADSK